MSTPNNISTKEIIDYIKLNKKIYRKDITIIFNTHNHLDKLFKDLIDNNIIKKQKERRLIVYTLSPEYNNKIISTTYKNTIIDDYFIKSDNTHGVFNYISKVEYRRRQKNEFKEFYYLLMENYDNITDYDLNKKNIPFIRKFAIIDNYIYILYYNYPIELVAKIKVFKL